MTTALKNEYHPSWNDFENLLGMLRCLVGLELSLDHSQEIGNRLCTVSKLVSLVRDYRFGKPIFI